MTAVDVKKIKYAILLSLIFILIKSYQSLQFLLLIKAIIVSVFVSLPILALVYIYYKKIESIPSSIKKGIGMLSVPLFLIGWNYLHHASPYYETIVVLLIVYVLAETIVLSNKTNTDT